MQRAIITPSVLAANALAELKQWLAITTTRDDAALGQLLRAALDMCAAFTRQVPLETEFEERHAPPSGWQKLGLSPVVSITRVDAIASDGSRNAMAPGEYLLDLGFDGSGRFRLLVPVTAAGIAVRYTAGLSAGWDGLPAAMRHGIIRLAAHWFHERGADTAPPAAVTALWQPYRTPRLS